MGSGVCAVVVAYNPDRAMNELLVSVMQQVSAMVVIDNTPPETKQQSIVLPDALGARALLIENPKNLGVGVALNQGLKQALAWQCDWLLTLDQDSKCHFDMVETLLHVATSTKVLPMVVGSNYLDPRNGTTKVPAGGAGECLDQKTVITSGSLVNVRFAEAIGRFREDYFIDQLDHEFCLRVRASGGRVVITRKPVMEHSVGEVGGVWFPFLGHLPNHPPVRKYYVARNSLVTIASYWRTDAQWCMRRLVRLFLGFLLMATLERQRLQKLKSFIAGVVDALAGRMGSGRRAE